MGKTLVAYFSATGTTERLARALAEVAGADLHGIEPAQPYTSSDLNWHDARSRSSVEMNDPASRPAIANKVADMGCYDTVFVGFPIWWYVAPTIINTFLEAYDFSGKTVIPFATSGGSGMGKTDAVLRKCCAPDTRWKPGRCFYGGADAAALRAWVEGLGL
ncbi:flavodoxin [Gordonibacter sp. An232A]|nr:flavodoxin [Gordonibacter sp. An232A]